MTELFTSGRIADVIIAVLAIEAVVLTLLRWRRGIGPPTGVLLSFLASGAGLALALKAVLAGAPWSLTAAALTLSLAAHIASLAATWGR